MLFLQNEKTDDELSDNGSYLYTGERLQEFLVVLKSYTIESDVNPF